MTVLILQELSGSTTIICKIGHVVAGQVSSIVCGVPTAVLSSKLRIGQGLIGDITIIRRKSVVLMTGYFWRDWTRDILETRGPVATLVNEVISSVWFAQYLEC